MGKKSRKKKYKRQTTAGFDKGGIEQGSGTQIKTEAQGQAAGEGAGGADFVEEKETGIARVLLFLAKLGIYLSLFAPLVVHSAFYFPFVGPKSLVFMGLAQLVIFSWLGLMLISPKYRPKFNFISIALLVFFVVLVLSAVFGVNPEYSFWSKFERMTGVLMWIHLVGFFLALVSIFRQERGWRKIFGVSIGVAIIAAIMSLAGWGGSTRGGATIGNSSFLGTYLLFNLFFAVYLLFKSKKYYWKILAGLVVVFLFIPMIYEDARAAALSVIGGLVLLGFFYLAFANKNKWAKIIGKALLAVSLIVFLAGIGLMFKPDSFVREKFVEQATKARLVVWQSAWEGFKERPLLGWGPETFEFIFNRHFNPCMFLSECGGEIWFDRAHNIIFDTLASSGLLGFLSYALLFIAVFFVLWKQYFKKKIGFWACAVPTSLLIAYSVQNLTVFDMISSYLMFIVVLGFAAVSGFGFSRVQASSKQVKLAKHKWIIFVLFILFGLTLTEFVIQPARAGNYVIESLKAQTLEGRLTNYQKSFNASRVGIFQAREFLANNTQESFRRIINDEISLEKINQEGARQELELVTAELKKTIDEAPLDFRSVLRLSAVYNVYAYFDRSQAVFGEEYGRRAVEISPTNQQAYWTLAQALVYQRKYDEALALAKQAIELEPRWLQSYLIAIQTAELKGDKEKQKELAQKAATVNPAWQEKLQKYLSD